MGVKNVEGIFQKKYSFRPDAKRLESPPPCGQGLRVALGLFFFAWRLASVLCSLYLINCLRGVFLVPPCLPATLSGVSGVSLKKSSDHEAAEEAADRRIREEGRHRGEHVCGAHELHRRTVDGAVVVGVSNTFGDSQWEQTLKYVP